ncbi:hypothetical protein H0H92_007444 [Tricholoma furcatifolium]|nr:hypothetical protein H0H92_007444 [Tricholoma furcatifolium]
MWCTRWFLPLLLLPLPTAPPYFLLLFLFSLTIHAKPCFYCIVLLTTLFVSSCYWQPFPLEGSLTSPWAENVTTFAEALTNSLGSNYSKPLPDVVQAVDRCWCDFSAGGFFEPFNVTHWEYVSVQRLKEDLEQKQKEDSALLNKENVPSANSSITASTSSTGSMPRTVAPAPSSLPASVIPKNASRDLRSIFSLLQYAFKGDPSVKSSLIPAPVSPPVEVTHSPIRPTLDPEEKFALIRREYDLRPYGLGILVDFGWTR